PSSTSPRCAANWAPRAAPKPSPSPPAAGSSSYKERSPGRSAFGSVQPAAQGLVVTRVQDGFSGGAAAAGGAYRVTHQAGDLVMRVGVGVEHQHHSALDGSANGVGVQIQTLRLATDFDRRTRPRQR